MSGRVLSLSKAMAGSKAMAWFLVCAFVLAGCAFSRGQLGTTLDPERVAQIKKGETTEPEVVALLGAPDDIREAGKREVFHDDHYGLKHATLLVFSRVNIASDAAYVLFDERGVADQVIAGNRTDALQFQFWPFGD
jgi:hypothetical protein